jgi:hypothetical protein
MKVTEMKHTVELKLAPRDLSDIDPSVIKAVAAKIMKREDRLMTSSIFGPLFGDSSRLGETSWPKQNSTHFQPFRTHNVS